MERKQNKLQIWIKSWKSHPKRSLELSIMILPGLIYLIINNYIPMAGIMIAFKKYNYSLGMFASEWTGFSNFTYLLKSGEAFRAIRNTIGYNIVFIFLGQLTGVAVAIMLNYLKGTQNKKIYQTLILIPYLISIVVVSYIVFGFLSVENGFLNSLITRLGGDAVSWYTEGKYWPFILTLVNLWKGFGYSSILYYATVIGIDSSLYDAAAIGGCGTAKQIRHVTLPGLKTTIITLVLMALGGIMRSDFGLFYQVTRNSGALYEYTRTIDVYVYQALMKNADYSMSGAASVYQSVCGFILIVAANAIVKKYSESSALF